VEVSRDPALLEERAAQLELLKEAMAGYRVARFVLAERLAAKPEALPALLKTWLSWWRDAGLLVYSQGKAGAISNVDQQEQFRHLVQHCSREQVLLALWQTETAIRQLEQNANSRLLLENLFLSYPSSSSI
jgi:hypothetical protein